MCTRSRFLASERSIRGFPAAVVRRRRCVTFSDFGQDLLRFSDPPCCPDRPSVTILVWDVQRQDLSRGFALRSPSGSKIQFSLLGRHWISRQLLGPKGNGAIRAGGVESGGWCSS